MEAHAPHAGPMGPRSLRPAGSSLWLRWPEFGYGLRRVEHEQSAQEGRACRLVPWRGARDARDWPLFLRAGDPATGEWPWKPYEPIDADRFGRSETGALS
jgi:replicative DNA helicase